MSDKIENIQRVIDYWMNSSDQNYRTMKNLFKSKDGSTLKLVENMVLVRFKYQWRKGQEHFKTKYQAPLSVIQLGGRFSLPDFH
ncbi:hypothetical protein [Algoriphagus aquimarinus]|uniref:hypothetical protein n=1 Tax=Algoriphagus aquimarinus TaxID=237018 RepID=UPI0030DCCDF7|tara:strand:- start:1061 stop:1312 length:252 start_codon:yes stop_codon:yes gene_type:complete